MYQPYDRDTASPTDRVAWALCQIIDDDAPLRWTRYRFFAGCVAKNPELMADLAALASPTGEVLRLRQGYWDARRIMGFDNDGDPTPAALVSDMVAMMLSDARSMRADYDEAIAGQSASVVGLSTPQSASAGVGDAMVERACDALVGHDLGPRSCAHTAMRAALEAAINGECNA